MAPLPKLYQEYVGHDNNRDGYMLNMIESRVMEHAWRQWEPQIIHVHHQTAPFPTRIWLPPFAEPIASRVPYLMSREVNMIGMAMAKGLEERGQVGATHMGTGFDAWYPGYIDYKPMLQNIASFWTETALYSYATPKFYTLHDFPPTCATCGRRASTPARGRAAGGGCATRWSTWRRRRSRCSTTPRATRTRCCSTATARGASRSRSTARSRRMPISSRSSSAIRWRPWSCCAASRSRACACRSSRAPRPIDGVNYPAGTWVIPMDQEFAETARQVLDVQKYPDLRESPDGPLEQPYDAAGWTLPYQMGVQVGDARPPRFHGESRGKLKRLGSDLSLTAAPTPYETGAQDAAPFDSAPGVGFDTNTTAAAIVPLAGKTTGTGPVLLAGPGAEQRLPGAESRVEGGRRVIRRRWAA